MNSRMLPGEAVESYYGRVADTLRKWPNNQMPEPFVLSILVNGLYPPQLKMFVKEAQPATVAASLNRAKIWEECHYDQVLTNVTMTQGANQPQQLVGREEVYPSIWV